MEDYINRFKELITDSEYVENALGEKLYIADREFRQCYRAGDAVREQLPRFWFCDPVGNVVSLANDKAVWLMPEDNHGRFTYHFCIEDNGVISGKVIRRSTLCGIVWGSYCYGKAAEVLKTEGIYGFGTNSSERLTVSCHHKDGDKTNDSYNNLEFATNKAHMQTIHRLPTDAEDTEKQAKFMEKLTAAATDEEPDRVSLLIYDDKGYKELVAVEDLPDGLKKSLAKEIYPMLITKYIQNLVRQFGSEFFKEKRYLYIAAAKQILSVHIQNNSYAVSIPSESELSDKTMILC